MQAVAENAYDPPPYRIRNHYTGMEWVPRMEPDDVTLEWLAGWGVRYQALWWGSIELAVRHREDEGLSQSTVLVRINGVLAPRASRDRDVKKNR